MVPATGPPAAAPVRRDAPLRAQTFDGARQGGELAAKRLDAVGAEARRGIAGSEAARIGENCADPTELLRQSSPASSSDENNAERSSSPAPTEDEEDDVAAPVVARSTLNPAPLAKKGRAAGSAAKGASAPTKKKSAGRGKKRSKAAKSKSPKKKRAKKVPPSLRYLNFPRPGEAVKEKPSSQYRGVGWRKNERKWAAKLRFDGRNRHLGSFDAEIDAARAYDTAARKHVATDRRHLNFPTEDEKLNEVPLSSYRGVFWHKVTRRWCVVPSFSLLSCTPSPSSASARRSIDPPPPPLLPPPLPLPATHSASAPPISAAARSRRDRYAKIAIPHQSCRLGYFADDVTAAKAYDYAAREFLGTLKPEDEMPRGALR